ncbi:alpha/beta hydrolase [Chryseobacterium piperi]|uniref:Alpha/beta hydrolase n=1 Tax=Chryseobacterium piperi TaxID=558152 RepID=A0A086BLJ5_9FLAO|nr:DUF4180 domain-containing protein [Chryseobacterium piperi]ASW73283.1 DUF4180 domain-containing protein [Chryseobacterium piperi]KFF29809.1 alpha/beta hydrolase [Chryseobacterium piperi]
MKIKTHHINNLSIAEVTADSIVIGSAQDGLDLLGDLYYNNFDKIIVYEKNITPDFFDLKTKIAGDVLQKFSNYRIPLAIVGDFTQYQSKSMKDFIFESNKTGSVNFVKTLEEALEKFSE